MESYIETLKVQWRWLLEILSMLHYLSLFFVLNLFPGILFLYLFTSQFLFVPLAYFTWMYLDFDTPQRAGRRMPILRRLFVWKYLATYFPIHLHRTVELDPQKNYMFCYHPHGILGFGGFVNFISDANNFSQLFPGITLHPLTLNINFYAPIFRDYIMGLGIGAVTKESINYKLTKIGPGHSVMIVVGGAAEAQLADPEKPYRLKLKNRKGFMREALTVGAPVVPVFSFGESEVFYQYKPSPNSMLRQFQNWVHRVFRFIPIIFHGDYLIFPIRKPIHTVVGSPLEIPRLDNPTKEEIDFWHAAYIEAMQKLFVENRDIYGCPQKDLELF